MKRIPIIFIFAALLAAGLSCSHPVYDRELTRADALMEEHPDSALDVLDSLDTAAITTDGERARYALLRTMALEKNDIVVTDDSLITVAVDYYADHDDPRSLMLAYYYQGQVRCYARDYTRSIVSLLRARDIAEARDEYFWAGMIYRCLADIYFATDNKQDDLSCSKKSLHFFELSGKKLHRNDAYYDLARAYGNLFDDVGFYKYSQLASDSALSYGDYRLYAINRGAIADYRYNKGEVETAYKIYEDQVKKGVASFRDSLMYCVTGVETGHAGSLEFFKRIPFRDTLEYYRAAYKIDRTLGRHKEALENLRWFNDKFYNSLQNSRKFDLSSSIADYYRQENLQKENEKEIARLTAWIIGIVSTVFIAVLVFASVYLIKKKNRRIRENNEIEREMRRSLEDTNNENQKIRESVMALLSTRFSLFDDLCQKLTPIKNNRSIQGRISTSVSNLLKEVKDDGKVVKEMVALVDEHCSNLMSDFNRDFPAIGKTHSRIFLFTILGFSDNTIAEFIGKENAVQVQEARRYLKSQIKDSGNPRADYYLGFTARRKTKPKS